MYGTVLNNLTENTLLDVFWRDLQLSEIILKEKKRKEGRKLNGAVVKIGCL